MSRNEFLTILAESLQHLPKEEQDEILYDYEEHFRIGLKEGKSEEEIAAALGDPRNLGNQFGPALPVEKSWKQATVKALLATAALLCLISVFYVLYRNHTKVMFPVLDVEQNLVSEKTERQPMNPSTNTVSNLKADYTIDNEKTLSLEDFNTLIINSPIASINFINGDAKELKVHLYGSVTTSNGFIPDLEVTAGSNQLTIGMTRAPANTSYYSSNLKMDVYLPKTYSKSVHASTVSGSVKIGDRKLDTLRCQSVSGSLEVQNITCNEITVDTTSGSIRLDTIQANLKAKSVSGSITAAYKDFNNTLSVENVSGSISLKLPEYAEFALQSKTVSGKITNSFPMTNTSTGKGKALEGVVKSDRNRITASTISGSVSITK